MEKNVPIAFILPSKWQNDAESLGIETTSCLWYSIAVTYCCKKVNMISMVLSMFVRHQNACTQCL